MASLGSLVVGNRDRRCLLMGTMNANIFSDNV